MPSVAAVEAIQGHDCFRVAPIPASAATFEPLARSFALRLRGAAADLPAMLKEFRIANHVAPLRNVARKPTVQLLTLVSYAAVRDPG